MTKQLLACTVWLMVQVQASAAGDDSLMNRLINTIPLAAAYDNARLDHIEQLKRSIAPQSPPSPAVFNTYHEIYDAYKAFSYDSAYTYALKLMYIAYGMHDAKYIATARLNMSFVLLSAGLFKETYDSLSIIAPHTIPDTLKGDYYILWGRYYYDLANYANDRFHSVDYDERAGHYLDSAVAYFDPSSFNYNYYKGLRLFKQGKKQEASVFLEKLLHGRLTDHQLALTASTYSGIFLQDGNTNRAIDLLIQATIADIRSSTKETLAIFNLSELLYKKGDLKHAALCIEGAVKNAEFYGARQRKIQASSILPLIEGERINGIEKQKNLWIKYAVVVTLLVLALVILTVIVWRQMKELKRTHQALKEANARQQAINLQLEQTNRQLAEVNEQLEDANRIKEEYIGYFFNLDSEFYSKLDKIKHTIEQKLLEKRYDDIRFFLNKIDARKEKDDLLLSFDRIFLKLFPNFVNSVNALLRPEDRIMLRDGELLSTDLRIFALMRMGVTDPEKIAQILEYSVKTIYSYKSRIKNKAAMPAEEFEASVMKIKS